MEIASILGLNIIILPEIKPLTMTHCSYSPPLSKEQHLTKFGSVKIIDSTTVSMYLTFFDWAKFRKGMSGITTHTSVDSEISIPKGYLHPFGVKKYKKSLFCISVKLQKTGSSKYLKGHFYMEDDCYRVHTISSIIIQKIYQILAGYSTDDCADSLRYEPLFTEILGRDFLAAQLHYLA